jgi:hypothetical protein
VFLILLLIVSVGLPLWGIFDAASRPATEFHQIHSNKTRWVVLLAALTVLLNPAGIVASVVYLTTVRPRLRKADPASLDAGGRSPDPPLHPALTLASDTDRDRVAHQLQAHFEAGRLTLAELDDRVGAALQARTLGELVAITVDLPPL